MFNKFSIFVTALLVVSQPVFSHGNPQQAELDKILKELEDRIDTLETDNTGSSPNILEFKEIPKGELKPNQVKTCLLYTSPSPRDQRGSRMPSSA